MKKAALVLFFMSPFLLTSAFAQSPDLPLFEDEVPCPTCNKTRPNVGANAKPVDSVYFAPAPFPPVSVSMVGDEELPSRPFEGAERMYETRYSDADSYKDKLSAPVNFSQPVETGTPIQIKEVTKKQQVVVPKEEKVAVKTNKSAKKTAVVKEEFRPQPPKNTVKSIDAKTFNVAGLQLTMTPDEVIEVAGENGFEVSKMAYGIPSFMVTDFERTCRQGGLYQTRLIQDCVRERARDEDVYYISQLTLEKSSTNEQIVVLFSSTLSDNQAFKIDYTGFGDNSLGTSYKDLLKKTNRRDVFWKYVYEKYGRPSRGNALFWGNANGISMRAFLDGNAMNARIVLQDATQKSKDYSKAEAWSKEQDIDNPFSF